ncbi:Spindle and kinetochore-associated protein 2 [Holothuria leucospilota]|uniref:Protein FAM33A n=1 Tax=Holothuria leucospilota TaxID=206669 RepID=A0A9Q1BER9_HOLLE|nr:Spindle and kinetochore-associated protein 2 [Holothuria leucospilota]
MAQNDLEPAVEKMEAMFRKADSNLEYLSRKLNDDFQQGLGDAGNLELSPIEMKQRLLQVKKEFKSLQEDAENIKKAQEEMMSQFKGQLAEAARAIQSLQSATGIDIEDSSEAQTSIEALLGIKLTTGMSQHLKQVSNNSSKEGSTESPQQDGSPGEAQAMSSSPTGFQEEDVSPADLRSSGKEFVPVHESEFQSVSEFVRGRSTLSDVNRVRLNIFSLFQQTYRKLYDHFQEEPQSAPLTVKEMTSMGMRVTGATGQAKLKVLRALKIITISNKGDVKLV